MDRDTRLLISHKEGPRDADTSEALFRDIEDKRNKDSPLPVYVSDNWDPFEEGLLRVYSRIEIPEYCGIGRPPEPRLVPLPDLKYAQIVKKRKKGEVVDCIKRVVFGDENEVWERLGVKADGVISTSYGEKGYPGTIVLY